MTDNLKYIRIAVPESTYKSLNSQGIKPERLVSDIVKLYVETTGIDIPKLLKIATLKERITQLEVEFKAVESKRDLYEYMLVELDIAEKDFKDQSANLGDRVAKLDHIIIGHSYRIDEVVEKYHDLIAEIEEIVPSFDIKKRALQVKKLNERPSVKKKRAV